MHGALPAPLLLLQDPRPKTRLRRPLRQRPPLADAHHGGQELPGWIKTYLNISELLGEQNVASVLKSLDLFIKKKKQEKGPERFRIRFQTSHLKV